MLHEMVGHFIVSSDEYDKKTFYVTEPLGSFYLKVTAPIHPSLFTRIPPAYVWRIIELIQNYRKENGNERDTKTYYQRYVKPYYEQA